MHLVASQGRSVVGLLPLYLKTHSHGDFIYDWNWAPVWERFGHRYYPRLLSGLPYTPVAGPRLLVAKRCGNGDEVRQALVDAARQLVADNGFSQYDEGLNYADASKVTLGDRAPWGGWGHDGAIRYPHVKEDVTAVDVRLEHEMDGFITQRLGKEEHIFIDCDFGVAVAAVRRTFSRCRAGQGER